MSELLRLAGTLGSFGAAIWIWRFSKIASIFRYLAVVVAAAMALSIAGIVEISLNPGRALELGKIGFDLLRGVIAWF
jgi:hypothetical protein